MRIKPLLDAIIFNVFKVGFHRPMVRPFVVHEFIKLLTRIITAITAEIKTSFFGAVPEFTLPDRIVYPVTATPPTVVGPARPAEKPTGPIL